MSAVVLLAVRRIDVAVSVLSSRGTCWRYVPSSAPGAQPADWSMAAAYRAARSYPRVAASRPSSRSSARNPTSARMRAAETSRADAADACGSAPAVHEAVNRVISRAHAAGRVMSSILQGGAGGDAATRTHGLRLRERYRKPGTLICCAPLFGRAGQRFLTEGAPMLRSRSLSVALVPAILTSVLAAQPAPARAPAQPPKTDWTVPARIKIDIDRTIGEVASPPVRQLRGAPRPHDLRRHLRSREAHSPTRTDIART